MNLSHSSQNVADYPGRLETKTKYFMGVDLGQSHDPTAVAVVRRTRLVEYFGHPKHPRRRTASELFECGYLERIPLHTTYPLIVRHVLGLLQRPTWVGNIELSIDRTGVGRPVADLFAAARIEFTSVTIHGGDREIREAQDDFRVPKMQLVSQLQALLHSGTLKIQKSLVDAETLVRELQDFRVNYTDSGRMTFNAREGKHDDLVLGLAIAVWNATRPEYGCRVEELRI